MKVIDRTKAVTQHFLENSFKKLYIKNVRTIRKTQKVGFFSKCIRMMVFYVFLCRSVCWFVYGPFCHGALKLDISTLFKIFFL